MITVHAPIVLIDSLDDLDHKRCDIFVGAARFEDHAAVGCATICFADQAAYDDFLNLNIPHHTLERYND